MIDIKTMAKKIKTEGRQRICELASEGSKYVKEKAPVIRSEVKNKMSDITKTAKASELSADVTSNFSDFEKKPRREINDDTSVIDAIIDEINDEQKGTEVC